MGLAIIYSSVLGAWAFAVVEAGWSASRSQALIAGFGMAVAALVQFRWHDRKPESLWEWWRDKVRRREMQHDEDVLRDLNVKIGLAEEKGDRAFLERVLAPVFAFRRASGALVDRAAFLADVGPTAPRATEIKSVALLGHDRAIVECAVTLIERRDPKRFHNVRLFVRSRDGDWTLLGWANEPL